jgi:serine/threonine protein kinase
LFASSVVRFLIHRDIKPANIILGRHGETLVVDWGLAKALRKDEGGRMKDEKDPDPAIPASSFILDPSSYLLSVSSPQPPTLQRVRRRSGMPGRKSLHRKSTHLPFFECCKRRSP